MWEKGAKGLKGVILIQIISDSDRFCLNPFQAWHRIRADKGVEDPEAGPQELSK